MLFPALVILPGMIAIALYHKGGTGSIPLPIGTDGTPDYNMTIPMLLAKYFPTGMLGIGFTALMASFMSGMAGNVTAFNTVWTYDIYQSYFGPDAIRRALSLDGPLGHGRRHCSSASVCAYPASKFNNIMDMLQLVFGFVNAPLFATFLLGMFWRRATGHGAFFGLLGGTLAAAIFQGNTIAVGETPSLLKGGWLGIQHIFASSMAQNFWMAIFAFTGCFVATLVISLATKPNRTDEELRGLVYSLTEKQTDAHGAPWYARPMPLGLFVLGCTLALNIIFW